jgi:hypothetical protein
MEVAQNQPTKQSNTTTTIWRMFLELFDVRKIPVFCNPMLDTFETKTLDLVESLPEQHLDDKCLEMVPLRTEKEQKDAHCKMGKWL